jgi:hypothetical protein
MGQSSGFGLAHGCSETGFAAGASELGFAVAGAACANAMGLYNARARVRVKDFLANFITGLPYTFNLISLAIILRIAVSRAELESSQALMPARFRLL